MQKPIETIVAYDNKNNKHTLYVYQNYVQAKSLQGFEWIPTMRTILDQNNNHVNRLESGDFFIVEIGLKVTIRQNL